mgnify:CR=1 FL=1
MCFFNLSCIPPGKGEKRGRGHQNLPRKKFPSCSCFFFVCVCISCIGKKNTELGGGGRGNAPFTRAIHLMQLRKFLYWDLCFFFRDKFFFATCSIQERKKMQQRTIHTGSPSFAAPQTLSFFFFYFCTTWISKKRPL